MAILKHDLTGKYFYTQAKLIGSFANVIFSTELQTTINSKEKSQNFHLIQLRLNLRTNNDHVDGHCLREINFMPS